MIYNLANSNYILDSELDYSYVQQLHQQQIPQIKNIKKNREKKSFEQKMNIFIICAQIGSITNSLHLCLAFLLFCFIFAGHVSICSGIITFALHKAGTRKEQQK